MRYSSILVAEVPIVVGTVLCLEQKEGITYAGLCFFKTLLTMSFMLYFCFLCVVDFL